MEKERNLTRRVVFIASAVGLGAPLVARVVYDKKFYEPEKGVVTQQISDIENTPKKPLSDTNIVQSPDDTISSQNSTQIYPAIVTTQDSSGTTTIHESNLASLKNQSKKLDDDRSKFTGNCDAIALAAGATTATAFILGGLPWTNRRRKEEAQNKDPKAKC